MQTDCLFMGNRSMMNDRQSVCAFSFVFLVLYYIARMDDIANGNNGHISTHGDGYRQREMQSILGIRIYSFFFPIRFSFSILKPQRGGVIRLETFFHIFISVCISKLFFFSLQHLTQIDVLLYDKEKKERKALVSVLLYQIIPQPLTKALRVCTHHWRGMGDVIDFEMGRNNLPIAFVFFSSFPQLHLSLHYHFFFVLYFSLFLFYLFIYFFQKQLSISFRVCCPTLFDGHTCIYIKE